MYSNVMYNVIYILVPSIILCNHSMYLDYFHIQLVFDLVMDPWKAKYIIIIIIIMYILTHE
jgi:hypothetical protein